MEKMSEVLKEMKMQDRIRENLKKNYLDAKQDAVFQKLVDGLHLPEEKLIHYTSRIEDCAKEYRHCKNCKGLLTCKNTITGYVYFPENIEGNLEFNYVACKYQKKFNQENKYLDNIALFAMTKEMKNARMKDVYIDDKNRFQAIKKANEFITAYRKGEFMKGMYLFGNFGCGKTYLIAAMFNELAKDGVKSAIVFWPEFLRELKGSFNTSFDEKMTSVKKAPLLLIDDIGAEVVTPWVRDEILSPVLQYRMQEKLPTFFTSNLSLEDLESHLSMTREHVDTVKARRIMERVKHLTEKVEMISKNLR